MDGLFSLFAFGNILGVPMIVSSSLSSSRTPFSL